METWTSGYSQAELDGAQERYGIQFPPDVIDLLLDCQPANGYNWSIEDKRIRAMLAWPLNALLFDVQNGSWWRDWGEKPRSAEECREVVVSKVAAAPVLIPLYSHRFIPQTPSARGNPIFSMYGFDTIYYGSNLQNYFDREFGDQRVVAVGEMDRRIPFWSDLAEDHEGWL